MRVLRLPCKLNEKQYVMIDAQLATQKIFEGVPRQILEQISRKGRSLVLSKGDILIQEGEPVRSIYCILDGEVDVYVPDGWQCHEDMNWVNLLVDGACIGEYSFVDRQPASATVRANSELALFEIPHEALQEVLDGNDAVRARVYRNLLSCLVERLRNTNVYIDYLQRRRTEH